MIIHVLPDVGGNYTQYFFLRHEGTTPNTFCHLDVGEIYTRFTRHSFISEGGRFTRHSDSEGGHRKFGGPSPLLLLSLSGSPSRDLHAGIAPQLPATIRQTHTTAPKG